MVAHNPKHPNSKNCDIFIDFLLAQPYWDFMSELRKKFFARIAVVPGSECVEWTGPRLKAGYGKMYALGRQRQATHVSWYLRHGVWPDQSVLHRCDNPPCVNPEHLFLGSARDNAHDRDTKGRHRPLRGEEAPWTKLSYFDVREIQALTETRMSLKEIADLFGVSVPYVSSLRHGRWRVPPTGASTKPYSSQQIDIGGEVLTIKELSERSGLSDSTIRARLGRGISGAGLLSRAHGAPRRSRR